jgi:hypothetical protein
MSGFSLETKGGEPDFSVKRTRPSIQAGCENLAKKNRGGDPHMHNLRGTPFYKIWVLAIGFFLWGGISLSDAQFQQEVNVTIEGYTFLTTQTPLQLHTDTMIHIKNMDTVRHDFGSAMFLNTLTQVEGNGIVTYGKGVEGLFIDPGQEASIHLILDHPGRFQFQCSIHKDMKGEILLLIVDAV